MVSIMVRSHIGQPGNVVRTFVSNFDGIDAVVVASDDIASMRVTRIRC